MILVKENSNYIIYKGVYINKNLLLILIKFIEVESMADYPRRIKIFKRTKKTKRIKTMIDEMESGRVRISQIIKPRKKTH
jgi:hypothetical protein